MVPLPGPVGSVSACQALPRAHFDKPAARQRPAIQAEVAPQVRYSNPATDFSEREKSRRRRSRGKP